MSDPTYHPAAGRVHAAVTGHVQALKDLLAELAGEFDLGKDSVSDALGYGTTAAIERAVYHLESAARATAPPPEPEARPQVVAAWVVKKMLAGHKEVDRTTFTGPNAQTEARAAAAALNSAAEWDGHDYIVSPVLATDPLPQEGPRP